MLLAEDIMIKNGRRYIEYTAKQMMAALDMIDMWKQHLQLEIEEEEQTQMNEMQHFIRDYFGDSERYERDIKIEKLSDLYFSEDYIDIEIYSRMGRIGYYWDGNHRLRGFYMKKVMKIKI